MNKGMSLVELATEIQRQETIKQDYIVPNTMMGMAVDPVTKDPVMSIHGMGSSAADLLPVNELAHDQIATHYEIPQKYYDRMRADSPELLTRNVNHWMAKVPENRFVRTLDGRVRAFLSDKYRPLDNYLIAKAALPTLSEMAGDPKLGLQIMSAHITERRLYIQCVSPKMTGAVKVGDDVQMGITITNSEVGCGSVRVEPLIWRLICLNGMVRPHSLKRHHVGRRLGNGDVMDYNDFYATETIEADNHAFLLKIRDTVKNAFDTLRFQEELALLAATTEQKIGAKKIEATVVNVTKKFQNYLGKGDQENILTHLIEGGDLSQWGLANAITSLAHDAIGQDRAYDFEKVGGKIIDLSPSEWTAIAA